MGSGLSMASVNKIKELAGAHEYGLALDIVDSQDLSKSLNPQFLRLCGDIYTYNGRYTDARKVLLMAHRIAPEAKRIIFSLMELYLKLGYRELAKTYYDMYLFDADMEALETKQLLYVYKKANHAPVEDLEKYLGTEYLETIDYEWSYETFLVYTLLDKQQEALSLALEYTAHYTDAPHCHVVADALEGLISVEDVFYPDMPDRQDDDPEQEEIRQQEQKLLEADNLRMYPPEPEIVSMVDDREDIIDFGAKRKRKRFMKEQSEEASETDNAGEGQADDNLSEEDSGSFMKRAFSKFRLKKTEDENADSERETSTDTETDKPEKETADSVREITSSESKDEEIPSVPNFVLVETPETDKTTDAESVKEAEEDEVSDPVKETEEYGEPEPAEETKQYDEPESVKEAEEYEEPEAVKEAEEYEEPEAFKEADAYASAEVEKEYEASESADEHDISGAEDEEGFDDLEDLSDIQEMLNNKRQTAGDEHGGIEDAEMKEHFWNKHNARYGSVVTDDLEEDSFEAEADSVEGLHEESSRDDAESSYRRKSTVVFEDATVVEEDDDDTPVDDFSSHDDDEFGTMHTVDDDEYDGVFVGEVEGLDDEPEDDAAEDIKTEAEAYESSEAHEEATEAYSEEASYVDTAEEASKEDEEETESVTESEAESETESEIEFETESEIEAETEYEAETETETESETEAELESETEFKAESESEVYEPSETHEEAAEAYSEEASYVDTAEEASKDGEEETETVAESEAESETESEIEFETESEIEAETEYEAETETESETEAELESESESETEFKAESEAEVYESSETHEEATEAYTEAEPYVDTVEEISEADTEETEAATEFATESETETEIKTETESETESEMETETESETETETEVYESFETYEESADITESYEPQESYTSFTMYENPVPPKKEPAYKPWKDIKKSNLDFPVFRSSLFPEYHSDTAKVENRFGEIMEEKNSKLQENLRKEEQLQRETEALLASLGIDLSLNTKSTAAAYEKPATAYKDSAGAKKGPSRDELKASLKIDSAKKDILRKIKEYR